MSRIMSASLGTSTWRAGLADPYLHWKRGRSAWEMAVSWEAVRSSDRGLPTEIASVLSAHEDFADPRLLLGIVEHRVHLDTPRTPSQNDLWCVLGTSSGSVSVAVEGKAGEDFDRRLVDWQESGSKAKAARLTFLTDVLGLSDTPALSLRYQLFHRTASAVLEARRWGLAKALMLVQSFAESQSSFQDYLAFADLLEISGSRNEIAGPRQLDGVALYLSWVDSPLAGDSVAAEAV